MTQEEKRERYAQIPPRAQAVCDRDPVAHLALKAAVEGEAFSATDALASVLESLYTSKERLNQLLAAQL